MTQIKKNAKKKIASRPPKPCVLVSCKDNIGLTESFEVGIEYIFKGFGEDKNYWIIEDMMAEDITVMKERFDIVKPEKPWALNERSMTISYIETKEEMDELYEICEECNGEGRTMEMKCYGDMPHEVYNDCEVCGGEGFIIDEDRFCDVKDGDTVKMLEGYENPTFKKHFKTEPASSVSNYKDASEANINEILGAMGIPEGVMGGITNSEKEIRELYQSEYQNNPVSSDDIDDEVAECFENDPEDRGDDDDTEDDGCQFKWDDEALNQFVDDLRTGGYGGGTDVAQSMKMWGDILSKAKK